MVASTSFSPPNSLIVIEDASGSDPPASLGKYLVASTDSCIAVGCLMDADGETDFTLGEMHEVEAGDRLVFQGELKTPSYRIALRSVLGETILEAAVPRPSTMVRIWANHPTEPDRVIVGFE